MINRFVFHKSAKINDRPIWHPLFMQISFMQMRSCLMKPLHIFLWITNLQRRRWDRQLDLTPIKVIRRPMNCDGIPTITQSVLWKRSEVVEIRGGGSEGGHRKLPRWFTTRPINPTLPSYGLHLSNGRHGNGVFPSPFFMLFIGVGYLLPLLVAN